MGGPAACKENKREKLTLVTLTYTTTNTLIKYARVDPNQPHRQSMSYHLADPDEDDEDVRGVVKVIQ